MRRLAILPIVVLVLGACGDAARGGATTTPTSTPEGFVVSGLVHAGPTCPVVQNPPDPACADRPVADAILVVETASGEEFARASSGADGTFRIVLPPGTYSLVPQPVEGLMGTPEAQEIVVIDGPVDGIDVAYDTGIR